MTQQYGFRASNNLSEVLDNDECVDNLSIDRRDLPLIAGTANAGVTANDYQAIIGLSSGLEQQIISASSGATAQFSSISTKASTLGDTFTGSIVADFVNNDRPYTTQSGAIIGPSTSSYFSPASGGVFSSGGEYKLGPVTAATVTTSGLNYTGVTQSWSNRLVQSDVVATVQEQPSWTSRNVPLFLGPPTFFDGCVLWLDTEFSNIVLREGTSRFAAWRNVDGGPEAAQIREGSQPVWNLNVLGGKPAVYFGGGDEFLFLGNLGYLVPSGATMVIRATVEDTNYNIFSTLNNTDSSWNSNNTGVGNLGVFTTTRQLSFPSGAVASGTHTFAIRASQSYGLEVRRGGARQDYKASGFTYTGGDSWVMACSFNNTDGSSAIGNFFAGSIYAMAVFNRVLSDKEVGAVEQYFTQRFS